MTCIVGLVHDGTVYMGADSAAVQGWTTRPSQTAKMFRVGAFLIAYCGSYRMGQILQYHLTVRSQEVTESDEQYVVVGLVEAVRECLKTYGFIKIDSNNEQLPDASFLVGYHGRLYSIGNEMQVVETMDGYTADGVGREYALGALAALADTPPRPRLFQALEVTARFSNGVCGPFYVETLEGVSTHNGVTR